MLYLARPWSYVQMKVEVFCTLIYWLNVGNITATQRKFSPNILPEISVIMASVIEEFFKTLTTWGTSKCVISRILLCSFCRLRWSILMHICLIFVAPSTQMWLPAIFRSETHSHMFQISPYFPYKWYASWCLSWWVLHITRTKRSCLACFMCETTQPQKSLKRVIQELVQVWMVCILVWKKFINCILLYMFRNKSQGAFHHSPRKVNCSLKNSQ